MTRMFCPFCGHEGRVSQDGHGCVCTCGAAWTVSVPMGPRPVPGDVRERMAAAMREAMPLYVCKNEERNREMVRERESSIASTVAMLEQGPIAGGTSAHPPDGCYVPWDAYRRAVIIRDPVCAVCGTEPSTEVHHIRPRFLRGHDHPRNLVGLCAACHDEVHRRIDAGIQAVLDGSLDIRPRQAAESLDRWTEGVE